MTENIAIENSPKNMAKTLKMWAYQSAVTGVAKITSTMAIPSVLMADAVHRGGLGGAIEGGASLLVFVYGINSGSQDIHDSSKMFFAIRDLIKNGRSSKIFNRINATLDAPNTLERNIKKDVIKNLY